MQVGRKSRAPEPAPVEAACSSSSSSSCSSLESEGEEATHEENALEPWVTWLQRATGISEDLARKFGVSDWVEEQRRRKWRLAGHTIRRDDDRWSWKLITWMPNAGWRSVGLPVKRWRDDIADHVAKCYSVHDQQLWQCIAQDRDKWHRLEHNLVQ